jgi:hypothetical protein
MPDTDHRSAAEKGAAERFPRETAGFQMTAMHEQGLYRHLRFARPGGSEYWFDLITAPHTLIFKGDCESFVFSLSPMADLFDMFRRTAQPDVINPGYWSQKLTSKREAAHDFSAELFDKRIAKELAAAEKEWPGVTEAWNEHASEWSEYDLTEEGSAQRAVNDFWYVPDGSACPFEFDAWDDWYLLRDYAWWFLFACHGIRWGIAQYDAAKTTPAVAA